MFKIISKVNKKILYTIIIFLLLHIILIFSVSFPFSLKVKADGYYFFKHQIFFGLIPGIILFFLLLNIPLKKLKKISFGLFLINLFLLLVLFLPKVGKRNLGALRWINIGFATFQPSEFLKLTSILYVSSILSKIKKNDKNKLFLNKKEKNKNVIFLIFIIILAIIGILLIIQPDYSTLLIIGISLLSIFFVANTPFWQDIILVFGIITVLLFFLPRASYRLERIQAFLNPNQDPMGIGYQIKQSLIAIGSGRIFGRGFGLSRQKFGFLPQSFSDAIFSIFAEETGFFGSFILILAFLFLIYQIFKMAKNSNDNFFRLFLTGIGVWIFSQMFLNIAGLLNLLPLVGIPLPFLSYGGSHLIAELSAIAIVLNISKNEV